MKQNDIFGILPCTGSVQPFHQELRQGQDLPSLGGIAGQERREGQVVLQRRGGKAPVLVCFNSGWCPWPGCPLWQHQGWSGTAGQSQGRGRTLVPTQPLLGPAPATGGERCQCSALNGKLGFLRTLWLQPRLPKILKRIRERKKAPLPFSRAILDWKALSGPKTAAINNPFNMCKKMSK